MPYNRSKHFLWNHVLFTALIHKVLHVNSRRIHLDQNRYPRMENGKYCHENNIVADLLPYNPEIANLALYWTYRGRWCKMPKNKNHTGPNARGWRVASIECYQDDHGRLREAFAYGDDEKNILVWYDLKEFKKEYSSWVEPKPQYENTKRFFEGLKLEKKKEEDNQVSSSSNNPDQGQTQILIITKWY